jgi:hypothetical protein
MLANIATSEIWKINSLNLVIVHKEDLVNFGYRLAAFSFLGWGGFRQIGKIQLKRDYSFFFLTRDCQIRL